MANPFKIGDVVRLKSGGPLMTISNTQQKEPHYSSLCIWFDGQTVCSSDFNAPMLVKVTIAETDNTAQKPA